MRVLFSTCLYLGVAFATENFLTVQNIRDFVVFEGSSGIFPGYSFEIKDPITSNSTECVISLQGEEYKKIKPSTWNTCTNKSFSWKFDSYTESGSILEFKHQYRKNGIPCIQSNGPQCTTSRAYFSTVGLPFTVDSPEGGGNVADVWTGPYDATIFSTCNEGCGLTSGNN